MWLFYNCFILYCEDWFGVLLIIGEEFVLLVVCSFEDLVIYKMRRIWYSFCGR